MDVLFYHLTESTLEEALPPLVEKSLERGWRVVIQTGTRERCDALDNWLWTWREEAFLAHGTDRDAHP
ncbi:MAG: DNA polymerase III subunit chi, partial [Nitratireductor sp.]